jgi:tRNA A-37 threonylcarbamoyl transferase component Bud32
MPAPTTTDELLDFVRKSELVPPPRLQAFTKQATAAASAGTPRELADLLIAAGLLTKFQADQVMQGKWRGFTIGKYRVLERLGAGGMGTVYLCEHLMVGRRVAVKVLPTSQADNPAALGRFYREARAAGVLDHPNLVKAHDIDQDGALHFLVMEYIDGSSLQSIVSRSGPLAIERAAHYIAQAAHGLQHAHSAGLIHRDVKPGNILVERNGNVRVLDLGLARFYHDNIDPLTLKYDDQHVLGTADYVAPEQAVNSHEVDIRADIYSLGCTLYFCLTGRPPFPEGKVAQKLIWHQTRQPTSVRQLRPEVPEELVAVLSRMMAKNAAQRYQTPAEAAEALAPWTGAEIPPPPEEEMPHLCPALGPMTRHTETGPRTPPRVARVAGAVPTATMPAVAAAGVLLQDLLPAQPSRLPSAAEVATPRTLATRTPTEGARAARPAAPASVCPSELLAQTGEPSGEPAAPAGRGKKTRMAWVVLVVLGGALAGLALRWVVARTRLVWAAADGAPAVGRLDRHGPSA